MQGIPSDFHDEVTVKEFIGDKYTLIYLKKRIAEDQGHGLNERIFLKDTNIGIDNYI